MRGGVWRGMAGCGAARRGVAGRSRQVTGVAKDQGRGGEVTTYVGQDEAGWDRAGLCGAR